MLAAVGAIAIFGFLPGCIYESALESGPSQPVDGRYVGDWRKPGEAGNRMLIRAFGGREYAIVTIDGKSVECYRAFTTDLKGLHLANVQSLAPGEASTNKWAFFEYRLDSPDRLVVRMINNKVIGAELTESAQLRRAILKNRDNASLFLEESVYVRNRGAEPPKGGRAR